MRFLVVLEQALPMKFAIGARVGIAPWGEQVCGDIAHGRHVGHHLEGLFDRRKLGEELGLGVALQNLAGEGVPAPMGLLETVK